MKKTLFLGPLIFEEIRIGALCIVDRKSRCLTEAQRELMRCFAQQVQLYCEQKPREEERRKELLESISEGFIVYNSQAGGTQFNSAALYILGVTEDELRVSCSSDARWTLIKEHPGMIALKMGGPVLDVKMPVIDGLTFCEKLKDKVSREEFKFVFISGGIEITSSQLDIINQCTSGLLSKPVKDRASPK